MRSSFQIQAGLVWPRSARKGDIRGDGQFAIVNSCNSSRWVIWLFHSTESRKAKLQDWAERGCCGNCVQAHSCKDIVVNERRLDEFFREQLAKQSASRNRSR
jgi:hypothetical protein